MKLNLGCGFDKREGWLNADGFEPCAPDLLMDIEVTPWPLDSNAFEIVLMKHVLEHVGASFEVFAAVMRELYRVTAPGGMVEIHVPHVRHDTFWSDPPGDRRRVHRGPELRRRAPRSALSVTPPLALAPQSLYFAGRHD